MNDLSCPTWSIHPVAEIFPPMSPAEFSALKDDIAEHGVREALWTFAGQILDGRHRLRACEALGIDPPTRPYLGDDPVGFVVSLNLHRRHLNESQRGMVAANLANMVQGERTDIEPSANLQKVSQAQAAELLSVSARTVAAAVKVKDEGAPELVAAVQEGRVSVSAAAEFVSLPEEAQEPALSEIIASPQAVKEIVREAVKAHVAHNSGNNEWYTPAEYINAARRVMGSIDVDPASSAIANKRVCADTFYTSDDDGLQQEWGGNVWMNPPYAQPLIGQFCGALVEKFKSGEVNQACVLVNNATDTAWFHTLASEAAAVCFPKGRIRFIDPEGNPSGAPLQGQAVLYFGREDAKFSQEFCNFGIVALLA